MPRAAWLAIGALGVAILGGTVEAGAVMAVVAAAALVAAGTLAGGVVLRRTSMVVAAIGALCIVARLMVGLALADPPSMPLTQPLTGSWDASVVSLGSTDGGQQRALVSLRPAGDDGPATQPAIRWPAPVYAWLPRYPVLVPGDRISFDGRLDPAPTDQPSFADFLARQGAIATAHVRAVDIGPASGSPLGALEGLRHAAGDLIARILPTPEAGLASGILIGLRERVERDLAADFTTAGLSHVVAISGWNIALVGAVVCSLLRRLPRRGRSLSVLLAIGLYTLLAGASASVVRAAVMGAVVLVARESGRKGQAATALGLAVWLLLLVDPAMAGDVGFRLSVAATAGLLAWAGPLQAQLRRRAPRRTPDWLVESAAVSFAAQAATLPLILLAFGRLSIVSPLANLVAAPFIAPSMLASLAALLGGMAAAAGVPALPLAPVAIGSWLGVGALVAVARASASLPLASLGLPSPLDLVAAIFCALVVAVVGTAGGRRLGARLVRPALGRMEGSHGRRLRRAASTAPTARAVRPHRVALLGIAAVALFALAGGVVLASPHGRLRMTVMDVGQGDAILLEGTHGARILVDGGPDPDRLLARLDERLPAWDRRIDLVILSHPHEDHVAGLALLLERYRVEAVAEPGMLGNGPGDHAFRAELTRLGIRPIDLAAGDSLALDDAHGRVLWPRRGQVPLHPADGGTAVNNVSIVLDLRIGQRRMLLMGDVEQAIDPQLLDADLAGDDTPPVDVLKVAHHGSRTASTQAFVDAVHPRVALVSAGIGNPYGHPAPDTIARLEASGARVLRTDLDGSLTVTTDGYDLRADASGGGPRTAAIGPLPLPTATIGTFSCGIAEATDATGGASRLIRRLADLGSHTASAADPSRVPGGLRQDLSIRAGSARVSTADGTGIPTSPAARLGWLSPPPPPARPIASFPCYDRRDDDPLPHRGLFVAARAAAIDQAGAPHGRRGRGRGVSGAPHGATRHPGRPPPGRGCGRPA